LIIIQPPLIFALFANLRVLRVKPAADVSRDGREEKGKIAKSRLNHASPG
jgi:hypothetical protein